MLKIFCNIHRADDWCPMWFDLNGDEYEIFNTHSQTIPDRVDIEVLSPKPDPDISVSSKIHLNLAVWDNYENQAWSILNEGYRDCVTISNIRDTHEIGANLIQYNDFLFNRTKAYYSGYPFASGRRWYWVDARAYELPAIIEDDTKTRIYVAPNKSYMTSDWRSIRYRPRLVDHLRTKHDNLGWIGDYHRSPDLVLYPHYLAPDCEDLDDLVTGRSIRQNIRGALRGNLWGYSPPHNLYYQHTFVSIYAETIEWGTTWAITEKTYDAMIKGHFILPFSNQGFVALLQQDGWLLPGFIDYSYDAIQNNDLRFLAYLQEVDRLLAIDRDQWHQLRRDNLDILIYNRQRFWNHDYDRVDLSQLL